MMNKLPPFTLVEFLIIVAIGGLIYSLISGVKKKTCTIVSKVVIDIGGCDADGLCGVKFSDGTTGRAYFPVNMTSTNVTECK